MTLEQCKKSIDIVRKLFLDKEGNRIDTMNFYKYFNKSLDFCLAINYNETGIVTIVYNNNRFEIDDFKYVLTIINILID